MIIKNIYHIIFNSYINLLKKEFFMKLFKILLINSLIIPSIITTSYANNYN